ncbi:MAG: Na(+)-translocating NADH-quinone reductase subunit C [Pirellulaceae bacterium]
MFNKDSTLGTVAIAALLCVVCSLVVSAAAVALRPQQDANKILDQQKNILDATGLSKGEFGKQAKDLSREQIEELSKWIESRLVNLETGEYTDEFEIEKYDPREYQNKSKGVSIEDQKPEFDPGEKYREKIAKVYLVRKPGEEAVRQVVLPVYGKGLWSTLRGYMALKSDYETIQGLTFYEHGETPGLGGEVDNPSWKAQWEGKKLYDDKGTPAAVVWKGPAPSGNQYAVDGLSGATITSRGVTDFLRYWASDDGYGPFLDKLKSTSGSGAKDK